MSIANTPKLTIQELITHLSTTTDKKNPYKNTQMVAAVKDAALAQDKKSLEQLSDAMASAFVKLNPEKPSETMKRNARELLATLAYLADHDPTPLDWMNLGPAKAYQSRLHYGTAMNLIKQIYDDRKIDLIKDVFREYIVDTNSN